MALLYIIIQCSCNKMIEIPLSKNQVESPVVFTDSTTATSALLGIYFSLGTPSNASYIYFKNLGLYADELMYTSTSPVMLQFAEGQLLSDNSQNASLWNSLYSVVYQCNAFMEGIESSGQLQNGTKPVLTAEARFLRAYAYHYLLSLYENVPLILTTDVNANKMAKQADKKLVEEQMIADLTIAKASLGTAYKGTGRVRANSLAASALLARIYLYQGRWREAELESSRLIDIDLYRPLPKLEDVFVSTSKEAILQFWTPNGFVADATSLIPSSNTSLPQFAITENLFNAFDNTDARKTKWITISNVTASGITRAYPYFSKYKNRTASTSKAEYVMALRLAEQYLIRAESLARQDKLSAAINDLNVVRTRAGLVEFPTSIDKETCLTSIAKERRLELFGEWGHRLLDLKRSGAIDVVMPTAKPGWKPLISQKLPIPFNETIYNSNLIQHEGY